jgi:glycerol-3-phosphate dehydrogenase (NAD(P)+)
MKKIATIGAGNWGTALASTFAQLGHSVMLWAYEAEVVESIRSRHENTLFMPGIKLPENLSVTSDLAEALAGAEIVVTVMPSHVCGILFEEMLPHLRREMIFVSATKGLDTGRLMRMSEVIRSVVGESFPPRLCALSGPSFAKEVIRGDPTAVVVASDDREAARQVQREFATPLHLERRGGSGAGWVSEERNCHRRRRGGRAGSGAQSHGRPDNTRIGGDDSPGLRLRGQT